MCTIRLVVFIFCYFTIGTTRESTVEKDELCKISLKKNVDGLSSTLGKTSNGVKVSLQNNHNWAYAGVIEIGNPPQKVRMEFDTGSSDMWVTSSTMCEKDPKSCKGHYSYNHSVSSTYLEDGKVLELQYGTGVYKGFTSQDDISINGVKVKGQTFVEVTSKKVAYNDVKYPEMKDGVLGLGFSDISVVYKNTEKPTPLCNLISQGVIEKPIFAFYFNKVDLSSTEAEQDAGELVMGGIDPAHFSGEITYAPVTEGTDWMISVDKILINGKLVAEDFLTLIDSGTSNVVGAVKIVGPIRKAVFGAEYKGETSSIVDCSVIKSESLPDITFIIKGAKFVLKPEDYIVKEYSNERCVCGFSEMTASVLVLGNVFMRKVYTVFDAGNKQVGFAAAK